MHNDKRLKEAEEKALWREKKYTEILDQLQASAHIKEYFTGCAMVDNFLSDYARHKVRMLEYGEEYRELVESTEFKWVDEAYELLAEIQQKKLFDLQCLWRAEKIEIPGITTTDHFRYWEFRILNCPFLDPITEQEVELYGQYLQSNNYPDDQFFLDSWQDYDDIKEAYNTDNANRNFPDWYDYHNSRTGKSMYLLLPDIRGEKEDFYKDLWYSHKNIEDQIQAALQPPQTPAEQAFRLFNYHEKGFITWFVNTFDNKETHQKFTAYGGETTTSYDDMGIWECIQELSSSAEIWPIQGWYDWKEALSKCLQSYRTHKIAAALPAAFGQYNMYLQSGIQFPEDDPREYWLQNIERNEEAILKGRELAGEPPNFDF